MPNTVIVTLVMMFTFALAGPLRAADPAGSVIYLHHFAGPKNKDLNGQTPKTRPNQSNWISAAWKADGSIQSKAASASAWLPFTPQKGHVYTLSLEVHPNQGKDKSDWFFLGFCPEAKTDGVMPHKPIAWMLTRVKRGARTGQSFLGPTIARSENFDTHNGPVKMKIQLDTRPDLWTVQWFVKDKSIRGPESFPGPTIIRHVGFGKYNSAGGKVARFELLMDRDLKPLETAKSKTGSQGLVAHWSLDRMVNNRLTDVSGSGGPPGLNRGAHLTKGIGGKALAFDGKQSVDFIDAKRIDLGATDFTLCAWINTKNDGSIIAKTAAKGNWARQAKSLFVRGGKLGFDVGYVGFVGAKTNVADGRWHHVALRREKDNIKFFVDGKIDGQGKLKLGKDDKSHILKLGFTSPNFPNPSGFRGVIDEVRIYDRALTPQRIQEIADEFKTNLTAVEQQPIGYRLYLNMGGKKHVDASKRTWVPAPPYQPGGYGYVEGKAERSKDKNQKNELSATAIVGIKFVRVSVPDGVYAVTLIFVEHWVDKPGKRKLWVKMENKVIVRGLDIFEAAGGKAKPWVKVFPKMRVKDGVIDIEFIAGAPGAPAILNGLSVEQVHFVQGSTTASVPAGPAGRTVAGITENAPKKNAAEDHAAKADRALKKANQLLEKDLVKGYLAIQSVARRFSSTEAGRAANEKTEELLGNPKTGRPIKHAIKEREAREEMRFIKLYVKQKNYEVAYQKLRKILRDYRTTTVYKEAKDLLEKVRDLRKPKAPDAN